MSKVSYYTEKGLKKLREKLDHLKDVRRPQASRAIAEARDKGDLSENAEYDAAKEAQGLLELEISKLEETLANARIIDESQLDTSKVLVLSTVKIKNTKICPVKSPKKFPNVIKLKFIDKNINSKDINNTIIFFLLIKIPARAILNNIELKIK